MVAGIETPDDLAEASALLTLFEAQPLEALMAQARALALAAHGPHIGHSRKVFIPLTRLCRDVCAYCTFAASPAAVAAPYLSPAEVLAIARAGRDAGCKEALFTLGDRPETRYATARAALAALGFESTVAYLAHVCALVWRETGLLPHVNGGVMTRDEMAELRTVSVSQGIMLENVSPRLMARGGPHFGSPDKDPALRLAMMEEAGALAIPFTSGILIGIGETREERIRSLLALRNLDRRHGHIQEVIVQNFRAKAGTRMAGCAEPPLEDLLWTAAVARMVLGGAMNIQVPPNLSYAAFPRLLEAGINDWGGISPVTADHVNPEAPWPHLEKLRDATAHAGLELVERLAVYPEHARDPARWIDKGLRAAVLHGTDSTGLARDDAWSPGEAVSPPTLRSGPRDPTLTQLLDRAAAGERLEPGQVSLLFMARGGAAEMVFAAADALRATVSGETVRYVVTRNINYTNLCAYHCHFCAFSKGKLGDTLRGTPYDLSLDEVARRAAEAWDRGATEVCMQGGIHPHYTGETYLALLRAVKQAVPAMHVHAFSPLEVAHGAQTLGLSVSAFLEELREAGLGSLPGTAAEILDDAVRAEICPDKLSTQGWLDVVEAAHRQGLRTTSTIMFGHLEGIDSWATHLLNLRDLQARTGGFTEFVPLPFVHHEAPIYRTGRARRGPSWRETLLMHAVARLVLHPLIPNIQVSWVKLGPQGAAEALRVGANDMGGTLMNESISRAAGTQHGQELPPVAMEQVIRRAGRMPAQRNTLYGTVPDSQRSASFRAAELTPPVQTPLRKAARSLNAL